MEEPAISSGTGSHASDLCGDPATLSTAPTGVIGRPRLESGVESYHRRMVPSRIANDLLLASSQRPRPASRGSGGCEDIGPARHRLYLPPTVARRWRLAARDRPPSPPG